MHPVIATEGEVTFLRRLASATYGTWAITWPDSVPDENRPTIADDREMGYVALPNESAGRMGRRFTRADVSITADDPQSPGTGISTVEATIDEAEKRTEGDSFLEQDITRAGLGRLVPHVDFHVGDVIPVLIWGKALDLIVSEITAVTEAGAVVDWRVHLGGQLIADSIARESDNAEIIRTIAQERRERLKELGAVGEVARRAEGKAEGAVATAGEAKKDAGEAKRQAASAVEGVAELTPKVSAAVTKAGKASADVSALTPKVSAAEAGVAKATADVAFLTEAANQYINMFAQQNSEVRGKLADEMAVVNHKFVLAAEQAAALQREVNDVSGAAATAQSAAAAASKELEVYRQDADKRISGAVSTAASGVADAAKAIEWLRNPVELAGSIIAVDPDTKRPYWSKDMLVAEGENRPGGDGVVYLNPDTVSANGRQIPKHYIPVDPRIKYVISFWAKADRTGSRIDIRAACNDGVLRAPDGSAILRGHVNHSAPPQPSNKKDGKYVHGTGPSTYCVAGLYLPTEWTYFEMETQFSEGVREVCIGAVWWNQTYGVRANQFITEFDIRPQIPTQAEVDAAQNTAIEANTNALKAQGVLNANQGRWNKAVDDSLAAQATLNENQGRWNKAVDDSLKAQATLNENQGKWNKAVDDSLAAQNTLNENQGRWNKAVDDSLAAQATLNENQGRWNKAVDDSLAAQKTINDNQAKWNAAAKEATEANAKALEVQQEAQSHFDIRQQEFEDFVNDISQAIVDIQADTKPYVGFLNYHSYSTVVEDEFIRIDKAGGKITAKGNWTGQISKYQEGGRMAIADIPLTSSTPREWKTRMDSFGTWFYKINAGTQVTKTISFPRRTLTSSTWTRLSFIEKETGTSRSSYTFAEDTRISIAMNAIWANAAYFPAYGLRLMVDGKEAARALWTKIGPLIGGGQRSFMLTKSSILVPKGKSVWFEAYASAEGSSFNVLGGGGGKIFWVE